MAIDPQGRAQALEYDLQVAMSLAQSWWWQGHADAAVAQYGWVADQLVARGHHELALSTHRMIATMAPYCVATQLRCADQYARHGAISDARAIWDWAASELRAQGRALEAADVLAKAVAIDPHDADRRFLLGDLYASLGMIDAAVEHLHAASIGRLQQRRLFDFLAVAERLLSVRPGHVPTLRALALAHLHRRDLPRTFQALQRLLRASRGDAVAGELMVEILVLAGRPAVARTAAQQVAQMLLGRGDAQAHAVAQRVVGRAQRRHPGDPVFAHLGTELEAEPLDDAAIEIVEASIVAPVPEPSQEAAWEKTGVFRLVAHAMTNRAAPEEVQTNVFPLESFRGGGRRAPLEDTRPDGSGEVILGVFSVAG